MADRAHWPSSEDEQLVEALAVEMKREVTSGRTREMVAVSVAIALVAFGANIAIAAVGSIKGGTIEIVAGVVVAATVLAGFALSPLIRAIFVDVFRRPTKPTIVIRTKPGLNGPVSVRPVPETASRTES